MVPFVCHHSVIIFVLLAMTPSCQVYDEAQRMGIEDWEIWHNTGLCYMYLKQYTSVTPRSFHA